MTNELTIIVTRNDGWWTATCKEIDCSGLADSEEAAVTNLFRSLAATMASRMSRIFRAEEAKVTRVARGTNMPLQEIRQVRIPMPSADLACA